MKVSKFLSTGGSRFVKPKWPRFARNSCLVCYRIWRQGQVLPLPRRAEEVERRRSSDGGAQEDVQTLCRSEISFADRNLNRISRKTVQPNEVTK